MSSLTDTLCPCGSMLSYTSCCQPLHLGEHIADTPAQLMRSRYCAYALKNASYVYSTYARSQQAANSLHEITDFANSCRFTQLTIINSNHTDNQGVVEFKANYFYENLFCELHEKSRFIKEDNQWRYFDGDIIPVADIKIGRNDECPCHSGKKYKKCHAQ
ncbi:YchJ family protein [Pseudoalteromonas mariniglutinosa]|uniref:YchJ family protein n=1 Tax=Pseudoalteromonas mariniglutinosa TaxID=206042 RepID=UPI00384EBFDE